MSQRLKYISRIINEFDTVICGLNGVILRGLNVDSDNLNALIKIYQSGKKIMLASNCGWRLQDLFCFLKKNGVPMNIFYAMITAGEIAHFYLKNIKSLRRKYYHLAPLTANLMSGLDYQKVDDVNDADFIVATTDLNGFTDEYYQQILVQALHCRLPLLCIGNDTILATSAGIRKGAGTIAEQYAMMGGTIIPFGKPDIKVAAYLCEDIKNFSNSRCLVIGDAMSTDMRLGNLFGTKTMLLTGGIHQISNPTDEQINRLSADYGLNVDYYAEKLQW